jgi:high-affinity K+ transport system ATPase subunit B
MPSLTGLGIEVRTSERAEYLAAVVVALMYGGGQYLEGFAERRASREMTALLARVPRTAVLHRNGRLEEVDLGAIEPGDRLVVRKGDVVPVDGAVIEGLPPTSSCWWINSIACCRQSRLRADHASLRWKASIQVWVFRQPE